MMEELLFAFRPRLKAHTFKPSEDHPTEFLLLSEEEGTALGISLEEKRLLELFDGNGNVADIVKRMMRDHIASLKTLRRLLWDLDRYGFLEESPWAMNAHYEAWGYWGFSTPSCRPFSYFPLLGPLEAWIGRLLRHPATGGIAVVMFAGSIGYERSLFQKVGLLLIHDSVALAMLVMILSFLAGCLIASWLTAMVLQAVHPAPLQCLADYRFGIPLLRLDARRLRILPWKQSLAAVISPTLALWLLAGIGWLIAGHSQGTRQEWLFHTSLALGLAGLFLILPWNSTVLSREIVYRLRMNSVFWTMSRAIKKAFRSLIHYQHEGVPHEELFLGWGIWAAISTLVLIRLITFTFRWDFPILVGYFLKEENALVLTLLFILLAVGGAALVAAFTTFCLWLMRELARELRHRYWPQQDLLLVSLGCGILIFLVAQILWAFKQQPGTSSPWIPLLCGGGLAAAGAAAWRKNRGGFEPRINPILLFGVLLTMLHGTGLMVFFKNTPIASLTNQMTAACVLLLILDIYLMILCFGKLTAASDSPASGSRMNTLLLPGICIIVSILVGGWMPMQNHLGTLSRIWRILFILTVVIVGSMPLRRMSLRNHSSITISGALLLMQMGWFWNPSVGPAATSDLLTAAGTLLALGGLSLRLSAASKTALGLMKTEVSLVTAGNLAALCDRLLSAAAELYQAKPKIAVPPEGNDEAVRRFLQSLHEFTGAEAMRVLIRRIALDAPWEATQRLCSFLPVQVNIPRLSDWSTERMIKFLLKVPTFLHVGDELKPIAARARFALYESGETLIRQGERGEELLIIGDGRVVVEEDHTFGHTVLAILASGDFVGEIGFLSGAERTASVRALQPTLALVIHRREIDDTTPLTLAAIREAESGKSWLQAVAKADVFREFPPSLSARVGLESQQVHLHQGQTLLLESKSLEKTVAVLLTGQGLLFRNGESELLNEGTVIGLVESLKNEPLRGFVRAESPCRVLLVERDLLMEAIMELLTPKEVLHSEEEDPASAYKQN